MPIPLVRRAVVRRAVLLATFALGLLGTASAGEAPIASVPIQPGPQLSRSIHYQLAIFYLGQPAKPPMTALRGHLKAVHQPPKLVDNVPEQPAGPLIAARFTTDAQKTYAPPGPEMVQYFGRGLSKEQAAALQKSDHVLVMDFAHPSDVSASAHRSSLNLIEQIARDTGGLIWDEETREVFSPDEWRKRRLDTWEGDIPDVQMQTVIHAYRGDRQVRAITLGMAKFGMPDVVVNDFSWSLNRSMGNLINLVSQALVEGAAVGENGYYDLDIRKIAHARVRKTQSDALAANSTAQAKLLLVQGTPDQGDPQNRLAEIRFDRSAGPDHYARQMTLLTSMFGSEDSVQYVKHNDELLQASKIAKSRLPAIREAFNQGLSPGEFVLVKAPFDTPDGGREWMWVEVTAWKGDAITGLLKSQPVNIPTLHGGQMVQVSQQDVFDYIRRGADGRQEGNETSRILERMQAK